MCQAWISVYPVPDWGAFCQWDFSGNAVNLWLNDAYEEGLWDVNKGGLTVEDLMESGNISSPSDLHPRVWEQYGGHWNKEHEDAATFFDKFWNDPTYDERLQMCSEVPTTMEEKIGDFEEFCTDPCGCATGSATTSSPTASPTGSGVEDEVTEGDSNKSDSLIIITAVIGALFGIIVIVVMVYLCKRHGGTTEEDADTDAAYVSGDDVERSGLME